MPLFSADFVMAFSGTELFSPIEPTAESADTLAPTLIFNIIPVLAPLDKWLGRKARIAFTIGAILLALLICSLGMVCIKLLPQFRRTWYALGIEE